MSGKDQAYRPTGGDLNRAAQIDNGAILGSCMDALGGLYAYATDRLVPDDEASNFVASLIEQVRLFTLGCSISYFNTDEGSIHYDILMGRFEPQEEQEPVVLSEATQQKILDYLEGTPRVAVDSQELLLMSHADMRTMGLNNDEVAEIQALILQKYGVNWPSVNIEADSLEDLMHAVDVASGEKSPEIDIDAENHVASPSSQLALLALFSARQLEVLADQGITTLEGLTALNADQLLKLPYMKEPKADAVKAVLKENGLRLKRRPRNDKGKKRTKKR